VWCEKAEKVETNTSNPKNARNADDIFGWCFGGKTKHAIELIEEDQRG
jgi:hypothetical protein